VTVSIQLLRLQKSISNDHDYNFSYAYHNLKNEKWSHSDVYKYWKKGVEGGDKIYVTIKTLLGDQNDTKLRKILKEYPGLNTVNIEEVTLEPTLDNKSVK
jgi:hypothetical protein